MKHQDIIIIVVVVVVVVVVVIVKHRTSSDLCYINKVMKFNGRQTSAVPLYQYETMSSSCYYKTRDNYTAADVFVDP